MRQLGRLVIVGAGLTAVLAPVAVAVELGDLCGTTVTSNTMILKSQETIPTSCAITVDLGVKLRIEKSDISVDLDLVIWGEKDATISIKNSTLEVAGNLDLDAWASNVRVKKSDLVAGGDLYLGTSGDYPVFRVERNTLTAAGVIRLSRDFGLTIADDNEFYGDRITFGNDSGNIDIYDNLFVATSYLSFGTAGWSGTMNAVDNSFTVTAGPLYLSTWGNVLVLDNDFWVDELLEIRASNKIQVIDNYFDVGGDITIKMEDPAGICQTSGNTGNPVACE